MRPPVMFRWTIHFRDEEETRTVSWPDAVNREPGWVVIEHRNGSDPHGAPFKRKFIPAYRVEIIEEARA